MATMGKLKPLRGTSSDLANIVLEEGEVAFDYLPDNSYGDYGIKMGDGTTPYSNLPYFIKRTKLDTDYDYGTDEAALLNNLAHPEKERLGKIYYIQSYINNSEQYVEGTPAITQDVPYMVIGINQDGSSNTVDLMSLVAVDYRRWHGGSYNSWEYGKYSTSDIYTWLGSTCPNGYSSNIQAKMCYMTERWREATGNATGTMMSRTTKCKLLNPVEMFGYSSATFSKDWEYASTSDYKTDFASPTGDKYGSVYSVWNDSITSLDNRRVFHDKEMSTASMTWTNSWLALSSTSSSAQCFYDTAGGSCANNRADYALGIAPVIRLSN